MNVLRVPLDPKARTGPQSTRTVSPASLVVPGTAQKKDSHRRLYTLKTFITSSPR